MHLTQKPSGDLPDRCRGGEMQIYWTMKSIPELSQLPSGERSRLWRQCYKEAMHERQSKIGLIIVGLLAGIGAMLWGRLELE
jgi:hypothetical protein